jgi:putative flippase GtrA
VIAMLDWRSIDEWKRLFRYYQAGLLNAGFGYGMFAALVALGANMYVAQIVSHILGMTFNYLTYTRYAFRGHAPSISRYLGAYAGQYVLGLAALAGCARLGASPYLAGIGSLVIVSVVNYFVLKIFVYRVGKAAA